ncbi:MAG: hypothetical protein IJ493_12435 [Clostridia bacterium]|nr:hypothetical protein [Clostridia bacterium]
MCEHSNPQDENYPRYPLDQPPEGMAAPIPARRRPLQGTSENPFGTAFFKERLPAQHHKSAQK